MPRKPKNVVELEIRPKLLTLAQAAKYLQVGKTFLYLLPETILPKTRLGRSIRYTVEELDRYIEISSKGKKDVESKR